MRWMMMLMMTMVMVDVLSANLMTPNTNYHKVESHHHHHHPAVRSLISKWYLMHVMFSFSAVSSRFDGKIMFRMEELDGEKLRAGHEVEKGREKS